MLTDEQVLASDKYTRTPCSAFIYCVCIFVIPQFVFLSSQLTINNCLYQLLPSDGQLPVQWCTQRGSYLKYGGRSRKHIARFHTRL